MGDRANTPDEEESADKGESARERAGSVAFGETVYNEEGEILGEVRGIDEDGFFVTTREGIEKLSVEHARSGHSIGEAELVWRCTVCGEIGEIEDELPETCPNCGTEKENLMYWTED